ncbi:MAG TPA: CsgG/HfaB family protein [Chiayiivirga sp.]|jgi:curli biogenesis system outer membrane secretion channel CsgG|uniref:Curli production assembly/transport component CsgG n=1 Tax=Denitratimonas tolerans TaxID=1338420 RepID=A0AAW9R4N9_9GAMM|nr:CsgG/HfaB family protein [Xanthomonadaceae bacterium]MDX9763925.1 CsgG/HfaB family protein [Chiayiivirga sp.]HRN60509.1 CsgG/HfaB family protein [Chiayiivirga sp.]HRO87730.1 CsgG/HfaB family protein [Chiayiivirga sp.]HRQ35445.1 CsgG/HfaB family protein [Chiayiivirga sp.]
MKQRFWVGVAIVVVTALGAQAAVARDKPSIGVAEFRNESGAGWWGGGVGWELSGMLANELAATRSFSVVERSKLEAVLNEQDLGASGRVRAGTSAKIGQLTGAQYLVMGTVTSYEENVKDTGGGISYRGISLGGKSENAYVAVDIRVVDTTTGEIAYTRTIEGNAKGGGMRVGLFRGGFGGNLASQNKTPAGKAIRAALVLTTDYLECVMVKQDGCERDFDAADDRRRAKTRSALSID